MHLIEATQTTAQLLANHINQTAQALVALNEGQSSLVEYPTLGFRAGHNLGVVGSSLALSSTPNAESA